MSTATLAIPSERKRTARHIVLTGRLGAMDVVAIAAAAGTGAVAGGGGAVLLRRVPRGVRVPALGCALLVAGLWAVVAGWAGGLPVWWWPVPLVLAWAGVLLGAADLVARRLPDALTLPAYPVVAALLGIAAAGSAEAGLLGRAAAGALLWAGGYAAVRLVSPAALGGGDVKLAASLGALTAASSWAGLLVAVLAATALTAAVAGAARLLGHRDVPHGPAMLVAAWLMALHPPM
ncbi:MAG TPA: prepilin peptidase [Pseudonocardiaceae bacterium]|nr:prepilin peptidase [Pseudonocardiaceae bacterium]